MARQTGGRDRASHSIPPVTEHQALAARGVNELERSHTY